MKLLRALLPFGHEPGDTTWVTNRPCTVEKTTKKMTHVCKERGEHTVHRCAGQRCTVTWTTA